MPDDTVISFEDARRPHEFSRKEKRLQETRDAFENYLNAGETRQQRRKRERDRRKRPSPR